MSEEKTIDELKAELESLKKANLEREVAKEKEKLEEAKKLDEEKEAEEVKEKLRTEIMEEMKGKSVVEEEKPEQVNERDSRYQHFEKMMKDKYGYEYESYEDMVKRIAHPKYFRGR